MPKATAYVKLYDTWTWPAAEDADYVSRREYLWNAILTKEALNEMVGQLEALSTVDTEVNGWEITLHAVVPVSTSTLKLINLAINVAKRESVAAL